MRNFCLFFSFMVLVLLSAESKAQLYNYIFTNDTSGLKYNQLFSVEDISSDVNGNSYVLEHGYNRVVKYNSSGDLLFETGLRGILPGNLVEPSGLVVDTTGNIYVVDLDRVVVYNASGAYVTSFGQPNRLFPNEPYLINPLKIVIDDYNNLFILGYNGIPVIYKYSTAGIFIGQHTLKGIYFSHMDIDKKGFVYVTDDQAGQIMKFSLDGQFIKSWGVRGFGSGQYQSLADIAVDEDGFVWLVDTNGKKLIKYTAEGDFVKEYLGDFGGNNKFMDYPVALTFQNSRLYLADNILDINKRNTDTSQVLVFEQLVQHSLTIIGKEDVPVGYQSTYKVYPSSDLYRYYWHYTGEKLYVLSPPDTTLGPTYTLVATEETTRGVLYAIVVYQGQVVDSVGIRINPVTTEEPYALNNMRCPAEVGTCSDLYIHSFKFNNLQHESAGCNGSGYSDFTVGNKTFLVRPGEIYSANLRVAGAAATSGSTVYGGLWIDFNNDGDFEDEDEFIASALAIDGQIPLNNLRIPGNISYNGYARLRVRTRGTATFHEKEYCVTSIDNGETEDYSIKIINKGPLKAPDAITPNNDGKNDFFVIKGIDEELGSSLLITDAVGNLVTEQKNYQNDWPRQADSQVLKKGTYYYYFKNGDELLKGFFVINY